MVVNRGNFVQKYDQERSASYDFYNRSSSIHWSVYLFAVFAVLVSLVYVIAASKGYTSELALPGFSRDTQVGFQRFEDEYLNELSRYLVDQVERELGDISKKMQETMEANRQLYSEEHIRKLAKEEFSRQEVKYSGVDYASIFTGCKVYEHTQTHSFGSETFKILNLPLFKYDREPELILHRISDNLTPGLCWPFKGNSGFIMLQLSEPIKINEIVYAHVDRNAESSTLSKSAPQTIEIWGGIEPNMLKFLGETELTPENSTAVIVVEQPRTAKYIKLIVTDNYGADFTCLYRVYIYGDSTTDVE